MGGRADLRLADAEPAAGPRLRAADREQRGDGPAGYDSSDAQAYQIRIKRLSHTFSGKVSDRRAASRGTHFSRPHCQAAVGRYKNGQVMARLLLRSKLLRCRRTEA